METEYSYFPSEEHEQEVNRSIQRLALLQLQVFMDEDTQTKGKEYFNLDNDDDLDYLLHNVQ